MTPVALQRDLAANDGACLDRTVVAAPVLGDLLLVCPDDQIMAQRGKPEMGHAVGVDITGQPRGLYGLAQHLPEDCLAPIMAGTFGRHRHDHAIPPLELADCCSAHARHSSRLIRETGSEGDVALTGIRRATGSSETRTKSLQPKMHADVSVRRADAQ